MKDFFNIVLFILVFTFESAFAGYQNSIRIFSKDKIEIVEKINTFFRDIRTIKTNFVQFSEIDQSISEGELYIARPKKIRCEYKNPIKILLISNGGNLVYFDMDLDEISTIPWSQTPISFLMESNNGLDSLDSDIIDLNNDKGWRLKTKVNINDINYMVEYFFDKNISKIREITIDYGGGQRVSLSFSNMEINEPIDRDLFLFKNPRLYDKRR